MAAVLKRDLDVDAVLEVGNPGEFSIWVENQKVADKQGGMFPEPAEAVAAVRATLGR